MRKHTTFGLDLAKHVFHCISTDGKRKKLKRSNLLSFFAQQEPCLIAMEACGSSHYWGRELEALGHKVKLLPPQHVKGYLRGQKNDYNDAQAILEAAVHGHIRAVPVKSVEQQNKQALLKSRRLLIAERTRLANHARGILYEYGITMPKSICAFQHELADVLEQALSQDLRTLLHRYQSRLNFLNDEIKWHDSQINIHARQDEDCIRLQALPGFGPIISYAFKSWLGNGHQFKRGRDASAALGIVPKQHTSGDKPKLLGITKKGDAYLRCLVIHGARSVIRNIDVKQDRLSCWIQRLVATRGKNKATVALANKLVRVAWVIVSRQESYQPQSV